MIDNRVQKYRLFVWDAYSEWHQWIDVDVDDVHDDDDNK